MASALEGSGQKTRAGLGFASSDVTAPPESYAPAPDAQVYVDNAQPINVSEAGAWDIVQQVPQFDIQASLPCVHA